MHSIKLYLVPVTGGPVDIPSGRIVDIQVEQPAGNAVPMIQVRVETEVNIEPHHLQTIFVIWDGISYPNDQKYQGTVSIQPPTPISYSLNQWDPVPTPPPPMIYHILAKQKAVKP